MIVKHIFNINNYVHVKLKPEGLQHYVENYNRYLPGEDKKTPEYFQSQMENGYMRIQAWEFMRLFGPTIKMWELPMFETEMYVDIDKP